MFASSSTFVAALAFSFIPGSCLGPNNMQISCWWLPPKRRVRKTLCSHSNSCHTKGHRDGTQRTPWQKGYPAAELGCTATMGTMHSWKKSRNFLSWAWCHWKWLWNSTQPEPLLKVPNSSKTAALPYTRRGHCTLPAPQPRQKFQTELNNKRICVSEMPFEIQTPSSLPVHEFSLNSCCFFQCSHRLEIICLGSLPSFFYWACESHRVVSVPWLTECDS